MTSMQRRVAQVVGGVVAFLVILRAISGILADRWWYQALGLGHVWSGVIGAQLTMGLIGAFVVMAMAVGSVAILERGERPGEAGLAPIQQMVAAAGPKRRTIAGVAISAALAIGLGSALAHHWDGWLRFRHGGLFGGQKDPLFHRDASFYVFKVPFLSAVVNWCFMSVLLVLVFTAIGHYLFGGITVSPAGVNIARRTRAHVLILLSLLAFVRAAGYLLDRYKLVTSHLGVTDGAGYTDVHVRRPAMFLLMLVAVATGVVLLASIRQSGLLVPAVAMGLWAVLGVGLLGIAPAVVQAIRVRPNELQKERMFIQRNITATVRAYQLDTLKERTVAPSKVDVSKAVDGSPAVISRIRLWDTSVAGDAMAAFAVRQWFSLSAADIDRYNGKPIVVVPRQLDPSKLEAKSWVNRTLQYTHGYGVRMAEATTSTRDGSLVQDAGRPKARLYIQDGLSGYAILGSGTNEIDDGPIEHRTTAKIGVPIGGTLKRLVLAVRFGEPNFLISGQIHASSRLLWVRDVRARAKKAAPFLSFDSDPYPVDVNGKIVWVLDAYTTTSHYPYAEAAPISKLIGSGVVNGRTGLAGGFNYARNSVKAVISAEDGSVKFYAIDTEDPILRVYRRAFPKLFHNASELGPIADHLRYPADLFAVQAEIYGTYHVRVPDQIQQRNVVWPTSPDPETGKVEKSSTAPQTVPLVATSDRGMAPQYLMLDGSHLTNVQYLVSGSVGSGDKATNRPLSAIVTANVDRLGRPSLTAMVMRGEVPGPTQASASFQQETGLSAQITVLNQAGSEVIQGSLQVLPLTGDGLLYIRPIYVQAKVNSYPQLKYVAVSDGQRSAYAGTLAGALRALFGQTAGASAATGVTASSGSSGTAPGATGEGTVTGPSGSVPASGTLLDQLQQAYDDAQASLRGGDLAAYQAKVDEMGRLLKASRVGGAAVTTSTPAPSTTDAASTTGAASSTTSAPKAA